MTKVHCGNVSGHLKPYKQILKTVALLVQVAMLLVQVKRQISGGVIYFLLFMRLDVAKVWSVLGPGRGYMCPH